jgi:outer membrane immunogenic protein
MKKFLLSTAAVVSLAIAAPASAADLPVKAAPPVAPALYNWSGIYIGVEGGAVFNAHNKVEFCSDSGDACGPDVGHVLHGGFVGGEAGVQWQAPGSRWVFGIEGDWSWSEIEDSVVICNSIAETSCDVRIDNFGTARARLGYAFGPRAEFLVFVTGGAAFGHVADEARFGPVTLSSWANHVGWTVGGGAEYGITPWLSLKGEVLYIDLLSKEHFTNPDDPGVGVRNRPEFLVARMGLNWRFGGVGKGKGKAPVAVVAKY